MTDEGGIPGAPSYEISVAAGLFGIVFLDTVALAVPWVVAGMLGALGYAEGTGIAMAAGFLWTSLFSFAQFGWALPIAGIAYWRGNPGLAVGVLVGAALVSLLLVGCIASLIVGIGAICGGLTI